MSRRGGRWALLALAVVGLGLGGVGVAAAQREPGPGELWREYPLERGEERSARDSREAPPAADPGSQAAPPASRPAAGGDSGDSSRLLLVLAVVLGVLGAGLLLLSVRLQRAPASAAPRPDPAPSTPARLVPMSRTGVLHGEHGALAPLARPRRREPPERRAERLPVYEIGWEREDSSARFVLRGVGGAPEPAVDERSAAFPWEPSQPPAPSREAQRAHALLYFRLIEQDWKPCGNGEAWFAHRFRPGPGG